VAYGRIPYASEQGIFSAEQGMVATEQGSGANEQRIANCTVGIVVRVLITCHFNRTPAAHAHFMDQRPQLPQ
jgi:hypothetical protein